MRLLPVLSNENSINIQQLLLLLQHLEESHRTQRRRSAPPATVSQSAQRQKEPSFLAQGQWHGSTFQPFQSFQRHKIAVLCLLTVG